MTTLTIQRQWNEEAEIVKQLRIELADAYAARDASARDNHTLRKVRERDIWLADERNEELTQIHTKLKDLQGANQEFRRQLAGMEAGRDYWRKRCKNSDKFLKELADEPMKDWESATAELLNAQADLKRNARMLADQCDQARQAENERDEWRRKAQEQSNEVQESWLSPVEVEELKRQLSMLQSVIDNLCEQQDRQLDMEECGARGSYPSKFPEWEAAWEQVYELRYNSSKAATKLLERLATLDAAEAALAGCGINGIYNKFSCLTDAIMQMSAYISKNSKVSQ